LIRSSFSAGEGYTGASYTYSIDISNAWVAVKDPFELAELEDESTTGSRRLGSDRMDGGAATWGREGCDEVMNKCKVARSKVEIKR
jgi:hypothetical protein